MTADDEGEFVFDALVDTFDEILPRLPGGARRVGDGYRVHICPSVPFELFCGVWLTDPTMDEALAEALPDLVAEVEARGLPSPVLLRSGGYEQTRRVAAAIGLTGQGEQEAMVLVASEMLDDPRPTAGIAVQDAADQDALKVALRIAAAGFEAPEEILAPLYESSLMSHPGAALYVASVEGIPVSTGVGYRVGHAVGVYSVATPPGQRRRGYAGQIVRRIVSDGFRNGATRAYLLASPDGVGVYQRVGFRPVGRYHILARPA
jgi:GNAT superfamily N-acetyltransferase